MKRDWDLIRKILLAVESLQTTSSYVDEDGIEGVDEEQVSYHIHLMIEAGLIEGECAQGLDGPLHCFASSLTWSGHEFLDAVRKPGMWERIKGQAREKGLALSFEVIKALAVWAVTTALKG